MDPFNTSTSSSSKQKQQNVNPLSQALAETERGLHHNQPQSQDAVSPDANNLFSQALANSGNSVAPEQSAQADQAQQQDPDALARQQEEMRQEQKKRQIREKLHQQVNPVSQEQVFMAERERTNREIEELRNSIRQEFASFQVELEKFHRDVDIAMFQTTVDTGLDATGYRSFFEKLRQFIILLRQRVKSASTWLKQSQAKSKKKKKGKKPGMEVGGMKHEQTKTVYDMMNHEVGSTYGSN